MQEPKQQVYRALRHAGDGFDYGAESVVPAQKLSFTRQVFVNGFEYTLVSEFSVRSCVRIPVEVAGVTLNLNISLWRGIPFDNRQQALGIVLQHR